MKTNIKYLSHMFKEYNNISFPSIFPDLTRPLYLDIETTGFSSKYNIIYQIACIYYDKEWVFIQWLIEDYIEEKLLMSTFANFIKNNRFDSFIHYNGNSFDLPFIINRMLINKIDFNIEDILQWDYYSKIKPLKHFFKLENLKLKSVEKLFNFKRNDLYDGGDLIYLFHEYASGNKSLENSLQVHNEEDLIALFLLNHLNIFIIGHKDINKFNYYHEIYVNEFSDIIIALSNYLNNRANFEADLEKIMPVNNDLLAIGKISAIDVGMANYIKNNYAVDYLNRQITSSYTLDLKLYFGQLKYFFKDFNSYIYLPFEDRAIHQSLGKFVVPKYRRKASKQTAYTKSSGIFLNLTPPLADYLQLDKLRTFKSDYKDKNTYVLLSDFLKAIEI